LFKKHIEEQHEWHEYRGLVEYFEIYESGVSEKETVPVRAKTTAQTIDMADFTKRILNIPNVR